MCVCAYVWLYHAPRLGKPTALRRKLRIWNSITKKNHMNNSELSLLRERERERERERGIRKG